MDKAFKEDLYNGLDQAFRKYFRVGNAYTFLDWLSKNYVVLPKSEYQGEWGNGKLDIGWYTMPQSNPTTDHSYYNDANGKDLFYHFKNGVMNTEMYKGFLVGNIFKYITRHGKKDKSKTIEDLKKARDYLNELIEFEEAQINESAND